MSRTFRRKNGYNRLDHRYMRKCVLFESKHGGTFYEYVHHEGKEKVKGLAKYHSDSYVDGRYANRYPHSSRRLQHHIHRARARHELARYKKDNEYEVMIRKNAHFNYWH